jgi:RNA 2',3'-cyclic 3'-phosphodiesterase
LSFISPILRVFIALELPSQVQNALYERASALHKTSPSGAVRWVAADAMHLTLKFLGDTPQAQIPAINAAVETALAGLEPLTLAAQGIGCFPDLSHPKVVWAGLEGDLSELKTLRDRIEMYVSPLGYPTEKRPFRPHLTLGRVKDEDKAVGEAVQKAQSQIGEIANWQSRHVSVIQSRLTPSGAVYTPLVKFQLSVKGS